jgi:hypothetical protein
MLVLWFELRYDLCRGQRAQESEATQLTSHDHGKSRRVLADI